MASLKQLKIKAEDLLTDGKLDPQLVAEAINNLALQVYENAKKVQTKQLVELRVRTASVLDNTFPLPAIQLASGMPNMPSDVHVGRVQNLSAPKTVLSSACSVDWEPNGRGQILIRYVSGLRTSNDYLITFVIEG